MSIEVSSNLKSVKCTKENWEFHTKNRHFMEYIEGKNSYTVEVEYGVNIKYIYINTLKKSDGNEEISDEHKEIIRKRFEIALNVMGMDYEIC